MGALKGKVGSCTGPSGICSADVAGVAGRVRGSKRPGEVVVLLRLVNGFVLTFLKTW